MQQNSAEKPSQLFKSAENVTQPSSTSINRTQFPRVAYNPRFAVTPESVGTDLPAPNREPKAQTEPPLVDVKSYHERHHNKPLMEILSDCKHDSNDSFHSPHSNTPINSSENINQHMAYKANNKTEYMAQSPSPNVSPKPALQQWNFDNHFNNDCTQSSGKFPPDNNFMQTLKSAGEQNEKSGQFCYEQQLQKYISDSSAKLNFKILNEIYAKRIESIDETAWGDKDLKICTYKEWVELLTKINEAFIKNMDELEREVEARLNLVQKRVNSNCRHSQGNELMKCRKDMDTLIKYIRNVRNCNDWDLQGFTFETIKPSELFGEYNNTTAECFAVDEIKNFGDPDNIQKSKLHAHIKALAEEMAEKHDEVRELKRQVICLEDEIQKAQKKIQLKDDVIKELRNDLKCASNKLSANPSPDCSSVMPPINFENQTARSANTHMTDTTTASFQFDTSSQFDSLSQTELEEQQKIKLLEKEISEFFEMNHNLNKQQIEEQRKRLMEIVQKIESEKVAAYHRLDFMRHQLINLESHSVDNNYDCDSGFHSKGGNDQDAKILDAVRKRLQKLNETNCELKKRIQKLELDKNELCNNLQSQKSFSERNEEILKQIADLLCIVRGKQFSYAEVYEKSPNPFCEAITEMQRDFQETESQLLNAIGKINKQKGELSQLLLDSEKDFSEKRLICLFKDFDNNTTTLLSESSQPLPLTVGTGTEPPQAPPTSLTGQQLDSTATTATSSQGLVDK